MWTDWLEWKGDWYYLDPSSGKMHIGWSNINGKRYYFSSKGVMQIGWVKINGADYYFDSNGAMCTGWVKVNNKWYYMNTDGSMRVGWIKLDGNWYYLNTDGSMRTGWFDLNGVWYYCNSNGVMLRGWQTIDGKRYYFASDGHMVIETFTQGKRTFTFYKTGRLKSTKMDLERIKQGDTNWCWAASIAMITNYENNTDLTMEDIVVSLRGNAKDKERGASDEELLTAMKNIMPNRGVQRMDSYKFDTFAWYIDKNHPVLVNLEFMTFNLKHHAVVCAGYNRDGETLYLIDPDTLLNKQSISYSELSTYYIVKVDSNNKVPVRIHYIIIYP